MRDGRSVLSIVSVNVVGKMHASKESALYCMFHMSGGLGVRHWFFVHKV
jgi:hypothetical protein